MADAPRNYLGFFEMPAYYDSIGAWIEARESLLALVQTPEVIEMLEECEKVIAEKNGHHE